MFKRPLCRARSGLLKEQEGSEPAVTFRGYSWHPPAAPALVRRANTVRLCSCVLQGKVRSIGTLPQYCMSCGHPTDQKLFAGYIRGVRVTASWGAAWITPGNHLRAYFDLRVIVWLTVEGLCNMCTCSGNGTQERAVQDLLCLVDLYLVYLIWF